MPEGRFKPAQAVGGFFSEFWKFAAKGNVFDLAVAVILGNAFGAVVNSLVSDIMLPILSLATGNVNLNTYSYTIREASSSGGTTSPAVVLGYGHLLQAGVNFLIIGLSIFLMFKLMQSIRKKVAREPEPPKSEMPMQERLLMEIRDLLRERK